MLKSVMTEKSRQTYMDIKRHCSAWMALYLHTKNDNKNTLSPVRDNPWDMKFVYKLI